MRRGHALFAIAVLASPLAAQTRAPLVARTSHSVRIGGQEIRYTALVSETFVKDSAGTPIGAMVTTAYLREGVRDAATRPIMFLFNGGPGASSTPLHFSAFGPVRRAEEAGGQTMVPNADSPVDVVDLVFIDPIGTGFSRPFDGVDGKQFWSRTGDAASVRRVIEEWLKANRRERSPLYLCGESYGTTRATLILRNPGSLQFKGVLLFALVTNQRPGEATFVGSLPTYAAAAWYHERVARTGQPIEQVFERAAEFARTEFRSALANWTTLTDDDKHRMSARVSAMIGLPADLLERRNLRISPDTFMFNLLKDRRERTGRLDARATASFDAPRRRPPYDDPGMNYNPEASANAAPAMPQANSGPSAVDTYFKSTLRFPTTETYNALNLDVNAAWNHEGMTDLNPLLGSIMRADTMLRLFWTGGYYDITTPLFAGRLALEDAGIPVTRLTVGAFAAGHSVFMEARNRAALSAAVRTFIR